jgi:hypothetical protein
MRVVARRTSALRLLLLPQLYCVRAEIRLADSVRTVLVNIGSNLEPLLPPDNDPTVAAIAFEPIVHCNVSQLHPRLYVVPAAVSSEDGLATMEVLHVNGVSSSLSSPVTAVRKILKEPGLQRGGPAERLVPQ